MLETAAANIARAGLADRVELIAGDASDPGATDALGVTAYDRVFYSYTLSMMPIWREALKAGAVRLADTGRIHVVDFGQQDRLPGWFRKLLFKWLASFHVTPRPDLEATLEDLAAEAGGIASFTRLYRGYSVYAEVGKAN